MVEPPVSTGKNASKGNHPICVLHENAKRRVPNNMTEICAVKSKDYVMCRGRGSLEERDEQAISTR